MIHISGMEFYYHKEQPLFENLQLQCTPGNIYGLLGKNGSGKTTLLKIIAGLRFPKTGHCSVLGNEASKRLTDNLSDICFIPEEFYLPPISIQQYLHRFAAFYPDFDKHMFDKAMDTLELSQTKNLAQLSYGQKKKMMIAFGIASNTKILILDEPTNALDIPAKSQLRKLLASALTEDKLFLISTHQVRDLEHLMDPIIILDNGKIIFHQTVETISEKLMLTEQATTPTSKTALYWEEILGKFRVITQNHTATPSNVPLEMFFNTIISNPEKIQKIFSAEEQAS